MDPVGPWSAYAAASYNRLANATGVTSANDYHRQLAAVGVAPGVTHMAGSGGTATTSHQLLLQAAHASAASAVTTPSAFNPGRFLSPPPVGYDAVFTPLFHQKNSYNAALNQRHAGLKQTGTAGDANVVGAAADIVSQYGAMHHQSLAAAANVLFDHHQTTTASPPLSSVSSPTTSSSASPYQPAGAHSQLHSPFGILPHESVLTSGGPSTSKPNGTAAFENPFNAHFTNTQIVNHSNNPNANQSSSEFCQDNSVKKLNKAQGAQLNKSPSLMTQPTQSVVKTVVGSSLYSTGIQVQQQTTQSVMGNPKFSCKCGLNCSNLQCCLSQQQRMGGNVVTTSNAPAVAVATTSPNNSSVIINNYQNINKPCSQLNNVIVNKSNNNNNDVNNGNKKTQVNVVMSLDRRQGTDSVQKEQCSSGQSSPVCFAMTAMPPAHRTVADYNSNGNNNNTNMLTKSSPRNVITTAQFTSSHRTTVSPVSYCQNISTVKTPPIDMLKTGGVSGTQKSPDCGVVVPRRPSPLQAHSQSSPLSHVPSPAYPMYNSPVTSVHSPTHQTSQTSSMPVQRQPQNYNSAKQIPAIGGEGSLSPLDVSVQRRSICEPLNKNYLGSTSDFNVRQHSNSNARSWETSSSLDRDRLNNNNCQKTNSMISPSSYETATGPQRHIEQQQQQMYYSCGAIDRSVNVVKQNSVDEKSSPEPCSPATGNSVMKNKRNYEKNNVSHRDLNVPSSSSPSSSSPSPSSLVGRIPPPAHNNSLNQQQNDNYFEYDRWNPSSSVKLAGVNSLSESFMENNKHIMSGIYNSNHFINSVSHQTNQSLNLPSATYHPRLSSPLALSNSFYHNPHSHPSTGLHVSLMNPYSHSNAVSPSNDLQNVPVELAGAGAGVAAPPPVAVTVNETSADGNLPGKTDDNEHPKVIVPNIEEELDFLLDDKPTISTFGPKQNMAAASEKTASSTGNSSNGGFMASYLKFLQGERDTSPPPMGRNTRRTPLTRVKPISTITTSGTAVTTSTTPSKTSQSANPPPVYNPEDDPRYFPLPKTSALRGSLDSSDDENGEFSYFKNLNKKPEQTGNSESSSSNSKSLAEAKPDTETTNKSVSNSSNTSNKSVSNSPKTSTKSVSNSSKTNNKSVSNSSKMPSKKTEKKAKLTENMKSSSNDSNKKEKVQKTKRKSETVNSEVNQKSNKKGRRRKKQPHTAVCLSDGESDDGGKDNNFEGDETNDNDFNPVPQRTVPKRKAKENRKSLIDVDEDYEDIDKDDEEKDEDFEPDWNPVDDDDDLEHGRGRRRRGRLSLRNSVGKRSLSRNSSSNQNRRSKRLKSDAVEVVEVDDEEADKESSVSSKSPANTSSTTSEQKPTDKKTSADEVDTADKKKYMTVNGPNDKHNLPFNIGEFVVFKSDLVEDWPPIWRVHGKALLQKFESFEDNGETLYKSMPTFSGCTNKIADNLSTVPFRMRTQNKGEYVVEFLRREFNLTAEEKLVMDTAMKDTAKYQDNFEVYIQTLLSQALDSNFLAEIIQEKDEYFLVNMKAIDDLTEQHRSRVSKSACWDNRIIERSLSTWPCYNILYSVTDAEKEKACESCDLVNETGKISRVIVYGQPYNIESLEGRTPDPDILAHKDMLVCHDCLTTVVLYNKIVHQKYLMFIECAKRVNEKRLAGPDKDTTIILNELLADEAWLSQLFKKVRSTWAEVNRFEMNKNSEKTNSST